MSAFAGFTKNAARAAGNPNPMGTKQTFLPNFTLTLLRTPNSPPTFASFIVPLNLNKLDLRDYLFNGYGVTVKGVRSYILPQKIRQDTQGAKRPAPRKWFRPRSIKKMMVEMDKPFVWPEEPVDLTPWDKKTFEAANTDREQSESEFRPDFRQKPSRERDSIASQAKELLKGDAQWRQVPAEDEWEEVEQDQEIPQ